MQVQWAVRFWDDVRDGGPPPVREGWEPDDRDLVDVPGSWSDAESLRLASPGEATDWAVPGVPRQGLADAPVVLPGDVAALLTAVERVQASDPVLLPEREALERARLLMACVERLGAAVLPAVRDVDDRDLWRHAPAGSTRGWLRTLPAGEGSWLTSARLLERRPHLAAALADGRLAGRTVRTVAAALEQVPSDVPDEQVEAVVIDGVQDLLRVWLGAGCLRPTPAQEAEFALRRARLEAAVALGARVPEEAPWVVLPQDRLEPVLTLLAEVLAPGDVAGAVGWLLDALLPDRVEEREQRTWSTRGITLTRRAGGGWTGRMDLTDEAGQLLHDQLRAWRRTGRPAGGGEDAGPPGDPDQPPGPPAELAAAAQGERDSAADPDGALLLPLPPSGPLPPRGAVGALDYGAVGPGEPALLPARPDDPWAPDPPGTPAVGGPQASPAQRDHDALLTMLRALAGQPPGPGRPAPPRLLVTASLAALQGAPGALPATLDGSGGPVALSARALAGLTCSSRLVALLQDAAGRPVGVSREERDATPAQRDALRAVWGDRCAGFGCPDRATVPHHVRMHSVSGRTVLEDLVPLCEGDHHAVHDGKHALRLRDGRVLDEDGWVV